MGTRLLEKGGRRVFDGLKSEVLTNCIADVHCTSAIQLVNTSFMLRKISQTMLVHCFHLHNKPILTVHETITMIEWSHAVVHSSEVGVVKKSPLS